MVGGREARYLPFFAFFMGGELKQGDGIVELPELETGRQAPLAHQFPCRSMWKGQGDGPGPPAPPQHPRPATQDVDILIPWNHKCLGHSRSQILRKGGPRGYLMFPASPSGRMAHPVPSPQAVGKPSAPPGSCGVWALSVSSWGARFG